MTQITIFFFVDKDPLVCCSDDQVNAFKEQMSVPEGMMSRCPSCYVNFAKTFCHMTCDKNQSDFIEVTKRYKPLHPIEPGVEAVDTIRYYISEQFVTNMYDSCVNVTLPSAGTKLITTMCGSYGEDCTPHHLFESIGTKDPSPIQIDFIFISNDIEQNVFKAMKAKTVSCAEAPLGYSNNTCNCVDCPLVCTPSPWPSPAKMWTIWGFDGMWILMGFIYYGFVICVIFGFVFYYQRRKNGMLSVS